MNNQLKDLLRLLRMGKVAGSKQIHVAAILEDLYYENRRLDWAFETGYRGILEGAALAAGFTLEAAREKAITYIAEHGSPTTLLREGKLGPAYEKFKDIKGKAPRILSPEPSVGETAIPPAGE